MLGLCAALCYGCIIPSQEAFRNPGVSDQSHSDLQPSGAGKGLIKPYIPSDREQANTQPEQQTPAAPSPESSAPVLEIPEKNKSFEAPVVAPAVTVSSNSRGPKDRQWEDQKVKAAAMEKARGIAGIKKLKVCYAVKEDEWWVTLYKEAGSVFDLTQYTWNRDQDKLEEFLVPKRIPSDRLNSHLAEHEANMACEVLDPTHFRQ